MQPNSIEAKVQQIMVEVFEVDPALLKPEALLGADLGLDSLDGVDLVVALEKTFHCRIREDEARGIRTLRDIYKNIESRIAASTDAGR